MTPEQLKASILQRAMEGKLVPQDPTDRPASELLKRIKAEKEKLIAEGKLKRDKKTTELFRGDDGKPYEKLADGTIQEVEVPYEIPESWEWVRLRNIGSITSGGTPKSSETSFYGGDIIWITPADMGKQQNNKFFATSSKKITQLGLQKSSAQLISKNSVVYSSRAPIGHINIVTEDYTTNQGCKSITPLLVDLNFLYWLLQFRTKDIILRSSGTTFKEISASGFGETLIPLPPLAEQKRIVAKIERALKKVEVYAESYNKLQELDKTFPEKLKKSILQYAMQGKLVAQSPGDEPVEVLLEKIKAEKQKLFEAGKLKKKDLAEMVVEKGDDNSPYGKKTKFDIDFQRKSSWLLLPLEKIVRSIPTKNHQIKQSAIRETGRFPVVSQSQTLVEGFSNDKTKILENTDSLIIFGDHTRTLKLIDFPFIIGADGVKVLQPIGISPQFLKYHLECTILFVKDRGYARHYSYLKNKIIGIPSELEQNKITKKVDLLFEKVALLKR
ncbi:TPA: restriction endonuclease subunit S [Streptococcus equi subsp. zooepidemicus]|uniref:restriction endonuclease subunit S n=1 Tax=Streptococcus equi TaxID=1336 RepID=UPI001E4DA633|nr:restriction endonuclease subunit S [Streptococcus equi]MCD3423816.1 restriction endonuclease subunit S [Streptococcus equi subsp. zooepidemicus]HEL0249699.1 restriction endonuclease subunit S [Streptococcus equi subsp. zooepidemicus]HEL0733713.1 restriction endonuclease subunit S [Streptococcus equi subsp. zooepidemicus]